MNATYFLLPAALCLGGCMVDSVRTGPVQHETRSIPLDDAGQVRVDLRMGAGELRVSGGASDLMQADFAYSAPSWKPAVHYSSAVGRGHLTVEQPASEHTHLGNAKNEWDLRLNDDVPVDLSLHFGAGEARLDLGSLALRAVNVEMGVGELKMDLRGNPHHDYDVRVEGGVGEATIYLPANTGVYAQASGGIGGIKVRGLRQEGDHWVSNGSDSSKVRIHVDVSGGVGAINLIAE